MAIVPNERPRSSRRETVILKFGGGVNSRASANEINARECVSGANFLLDVGNTNYRPRRPFDLLGTAPNGSEIRGFATRKASDGTIDMLVQAGDNVYPWSGTAFGASVATVSSSARLRGKLSSNWPLSDKVLITDLELQEPVKEWDGTTFQTMTENLAGDFKAKYCRVVDARAFFGNVITNNVATPHVLVGSKLDDNEVLSVSDRPSSSIGAADPFFLTSQDLRAINGLDEAFGVFVFSTQNNIYLLTGTDAQDYAVDMLYAGSGASGDEALTFIGNDVLYGRRGTVESLRDTDRFGEVENDDLSAVIQPDIEGFKDWTLVYNPTTQRVFCHTDAEAEMWVYNKGLRESDVSPWSRWTTAHESSFNPTAMMMCLDPITGIETVFFGDSSGRLYKMEGVGTTDAGANPVVAERLSGLLTIENGAEAFDIEGWVKYRKNEAATITLRFEYAGESVFNEEITFTVPTPDGVSYYGGDAWYGGDFYYGAGFQRRLVRQGFFAPGQSSDLQIRCTVQGDIEVNEIGLRFDAAGTR